MRPTFSIIAFTVLSGTGYGLWFLLGLALATDWLCAAHVDAESGHAYMVCIRAHLIDYALVIGFLLVSAGLVSSLGHLGKPQRAWRALSQWRSSWLSREGMLAIATYIPATALIFVAVKWQLVDSMEDATAVSRMLDWQRPLGILLCIGALFTVYCTAHIYSSLKPIRAWHHLAVVPLYLLLALYGGALCWWV
ncbi:MAG: dimethyl sulfoxide reductase anchor subunit family protein, partial [Rhodanobacteraceae bacterium]